MEPPLLGRLDLADRLSGDDGRGDGLRADLHESTHRCIDRKCDTYDHGFGPFADRGYEFLFTCTAEETERLTRELKLNRTDGPRTHYGAPGVGSADPEGGWIIEEIWTAPDRVGNAHYLQLSTDATQTRVRISCGTI